MLNVVRLLQGPQALGRGPHFWLSFGIVVATCAIAPMFIDSYTVGNLSFFFLWTFLALGLSLVWGYAGILTFGQIAFFGLAGYAYSVLSINWGADNGMTLVSALCALAFAAAVAVVVGYFMFYGGVRDVFIAIVTLALSLVLETFMSQTAGPKWAIGDARLNGFNGMSGMPPLTIPWIGDALALEGKSLYWVILALVVIVYLTLRILVNSRFGNALVAIRENHARAEALGFDTRRYQLIVFTIGAALAGLSGILYTSWGSFITPSTMGLTAAAAPIVWVAAGGRKDLTATLIASVAIIWLSQTITVFGSQYALVVIGIILLVVVMFIPKGFVVAFAEWFKQRLHAESERGLDPDRRGPHLGRTRRD